LHFRKVASARSRAKPTDPWRRRGTDPSRTRLSPTKPSVYSYDFIPLGGGSPIHKDVVCELEQYPEDKTETDLERHVAPAIRRHMLDFLAAIQSRGKPVADIEEGHISTASCILANLALQLGRTLTWDAEKGRVRDDDEANRLLRRPYRQPWIHPEVETA